MGHAIKEWAKRNPVFAWTVGVVLTWAASRFLDTAVVEGNGWFFDRAQRRAIRIAIVPDVAAAASATAVIQARMIMIFLLYVVGSLVATQWLRLRKSPPAALVKIAASPKAAVTVKALNLVSFAILICLILSEFYMISVTRRGLDYRISYDRARIAATDLGERDLREFDRRLLMTVQTPEDLDALIAAMWTRNYERSVGR